MTIREALRNTGDGGELLLAYVLGAPPTYLYAHSEKILNHSETERFAQLLEKRRAGFSIAALVGGKAFFGLDFFVNEHTLIPRPETEMLVEAALSELRSKPSARILDMGTGTGNILIAIAKNCTIPLTLHASDISHEALAIARSNARRHRVPIRFFCSNLFDRIPFQSYDLITANLPYLTVGQLTEPSIRHEPVGALWGGRDGVEIYARFLQNVSTYAHDRSLILLEIDPSQAGAMQKLVTNNLRLAETAVLNDLRNDPRVIAIRIRNHQPGHDTEPDQGSAPPQST